MKLKKGATLGYKPYRERMELDASELELLCHFFGIFEENLELARWALTKKLLEIEKNTEGFRFSEIIIK